MYKRDFYFVQATFFIEQILRKGCKTANFLATEIYYISKLSKCDIIRSLFTNNRNRV